MESLMVHRNCASQIIPAVRYQQELRSHGIRVFISTWNKTLISTWNKLILLQNTVYMVHLIVILIWRFGEFVFIGQVKNVHTVCTCLYPYVIWIALAVKLNTCQFTSHTNLPNFMCTKCTVYMVTGWFLLHRCSIWYCYISAYTVYVVIFEWLNLWKQFIGQYYEKIFLKIGGNHFKRYIRNVCQLRIFIFEKCSQFLQFL